MFLAWIIILCGLIGLVRYIYLNNKYTSTSDAQVEQYITPLASKVSGSITRVRFNENQKVKKGDTLIMVGPETITAPYDGWVAEKNVHHGQMVNDTQVLVKVVSDEKWVRASFRERQLSHLAVGTPIRIKVDAYPNLEFKGTISSFSPASEAKLSLLPHENATGNFVKVEQRIPVHIKFNMQQNTSALRAGMNLVIHADNSYKK